MAEKQFPLDITLMCAIGLEGGLKRFDKILPKMPYDTILFVHEWNRALRDTLDKKYKHHLGPLGRAVLRMGFAPKTVSRLIDFQAEVPYRGYYYAKRFLMAYHFVVPHLYLKPYDRVLYDFGRGLSPLTPFIAQKFNNVTVFSRDNDLTNDIFADTTNKMGLPAPMYEWPTSVANKRNSIYMSLGTYVYMPMEHQVQELKWAADNTEHFFIELEYGDNQADSGVVNNLGAQYSGGWTNAKVGKAIGCSGADNRWAVSRVWGTGLPGEPKMLYSMPLWGQKALINSTERFLQR